MKTIEDVREAVSKRRNVRWLKNNSLRKYGKVYGCNYTFGYRSSSTCDYLLTKDCYERYLKKKKIPIDDVVFEKRHLFTDNPDVIITLLERKTLIPNSVTSPENEEIVSLLRSTESSGDEELDLLPRRKKIQTCLFKDKYRYRAHFSVRYITADGSGVLSKSLETLSTVDEFKCNDLGDFRVSPKIGHYVQNYDDSQTFSWNRMFHHDFTENNVFYFNDMSELVVMKMKCGNAIRMTSITEVIVLNKDNQEKPTDESNSTKKRTKPFFHRSRYKS